MKKNKIILILGLVGVLLFCFSAKKIEKKITVTDIPRQYIGNYAFFGIADSKSNKTVALTLPPKVIRSDSVTISLLDGKSYKPYTGTGSFIFIITIVETEDINSKNLYTGASFSMKISAEETSISFDDLMKT